MLLWAIVGVVLIGVVLPDAFETIVLPRRVACRLRLARLVLRPPWQLLESHLSYPILAYYHSQHDRVVPSKKST
jgi:hypothetical protein